MSKLFIEGKIIANVGELWARERTLVILPSETITIIRYHDSFGRIDLEEAAKICGYEHHWDHHEQADEWTRGKRS